MILNESPAYLYDGTFENFYKQALQNNEKFIKTKVQPKQNYFIKDNFRIISDAIAHVTQGHCLSIEQWDYVINLLKEQKIIRQEESLSPRQCGKPVILYALSDGIDLYGICVEYFKTNKLPIITTAFVGTEKELNEWFKRNEELNMKKRRVRQDDGTHHLLSEKESLLGRNSNNIINENDKNVNPFVKLNEKIAYHGTDKQFDKFDKSYIYTNYAELGYGFYFDTDIANAESYGNKIFKVKLTYKKPFILSKSTYNWLAENLGEDTIDFKPEIENLIKLISVDTLRATDIIQSKYDAIIADTQIVVFEPEQIEILEKIKETLSIKQLVERMEEFEEVQVLNQKELINELYKSKIEFRITYDANKNWFLIATAYNHTHEELLYNAAPAYGLNFNQMVDYYNAHYADLFDLIYTPKTENIKVGFDHNNIAYIFNNFGTIYTKGQELSKNILNDFTNRFGKPNIKRLEESLHKNLNDNFYKWFDGSKVTENSKPLIVYHASDTEFDTFDINYFGYNDEGWLGTGFYFTNDHKQASNYAENKPKAYYLSIKNPLYIKSESMNHKDIDEYKLKLMGETDMTKRNNISWLCDAFDKFLKDNKYDGVIFEWIGHDYKEYVALKPNQIKSVDAKEFSNSENIYETLNREIKRYL